MRAFFPAAAISLGLEVAVGAVFLGSTPLLVTSLLAIACGTRDLLHLADVRFSHLVAEALDCLLLAAVFLVLCLFKPACSDAPHELD